MKTLLNALRLNDVIRMSDDASGPGGRAESGATGAADGGGNSTNTGAGGGDSNADGSAGSAVSDAAAAGSEGNKDNQGAAGDQGKTEGGEDKGAGDQGKATEGAEQVTAETLKLPEGFELDAGQKETFDSFLEVVNGEGTPAERGEKLMALYAKAQEAELNRQADAWINRQKEMAKEITEGQEFGGDKLEKAQSQVAHVINEFATPELVEAIDTTGIGNNIHFFRFLHKIGGILSEGKPVVGDPTSGNNPTLAQRLYPNQGQT